VRGEYLSQDYYSHATLLLKMNRTTMAKRVVSAAALRKLKPMLP
jgi:hypothetical protein